tara:strand:- start:172 stop:513 length:342 start_codon:yes stop_codon:yes gene_type:complete
MLKHLYNNIKNSTFKKNIPKWSRINTPNLNIKVSCSALATQQHVANDETRNIFYEIEILHKNIELLQARPSEDIICPVCYGKGYISCPSCKNGCHDCHESGEINCPLCNRSLY